MKKIDEKIKQGVVNTLRVRKTTRMEKNTTRNCIWTSS